jgi:Mn-containing catalase
MSSGNTLTGPWNTGESTQLRETWQFIEDPISHVIETNGLLDQQIRGSNRTEEEVQELNKELGEMRSEIVNMAAPIGPQQWNPPISDDDEKATRHTNARKKSK